MGIVYHGPLLKIKEEITMTRYAPIIQTPLGIAPLIGSTMTPEREREIATAAALRDMPRLGLEPDVRNLAAYFRMVREVLA